MKLDNLNMEELQDIVNSPDTPLIVKKYCQARYQMLDNIKTNNLKEAERYSNICDRLFGSLPEDWVF